VLSLARYSLMLGVFALVAAVAGLAVLYRGLAYDALIDGETRANTALTRAFANAIWSDHGAYLRGARELGSAALAARPEVARLDRDLRLLKAGTEVVKVKIYDTRGMTAYSTDPKQIGEDKSGNPGVQRALGGVAASDITFRECFDAWEGVINDRSLIATYVPVRLQESGTVEAVMELYTDVTTLVRRMEAGFWKILAGMLAAIGLVYAAGLWILASYHRLLRAQEAERVSREERIRHQAYHDALTGLPNRANFEEHLEEAVRRARRARRLLGVMFLDVDQFKRVNDSLGHDVGDQLLRVLTGRIRGCLRDTDLLFRMGGDEFTVILEELHAPEEAASIARRVLEAVREPAELRQHRLEVSVSIGIALHPKDGTDGDRLVRGADTAMYRAKQLGRDRFVFFAPDLDERAA
jgi:diguanylate cyclase (GGDEF)-like protein